MASDRAFRILARSQPEVVEAFFRLVAPDLLPPELSITPEDVGDPHLDALSTEIKADWLVHAGPLVVIHAECQGYADGDFPERLIRYHLAGSLRYWDRRLHTLALWLIRPPSGQARELLTRGDLQLKVRSVVLSKISASTLLRDPRTACFAAGADPEGLTAAELCARLVAALLQGGATWNQWRFAGVVARMQGRYKEMVKAMQDAKVEPLITHELIQFCKEDGALEEAREALLDTLDARGLAVLPTERRRIRREASIDRLRVWRKRAAVMASAAEVFADDPPGRRARRTAPRG